MEIVNIKKHKINKEYIKHYNFIIRRIPNSIFTVQHLTDTFPNIVNFSTERNEDELIAYFNFEDDYANYLYNLLNGKVFQKDNYWYPIEVIYRNKNGKVLESKPYKKKVEICLNDILVPLLLTISIIYACYF